MSTKKKNDNNNKNDNVPRKSLPQADLSAKRKEVFDLKIGKKKTNH